MSKSKNLNFGNSMPSVTFTKKNAYSICVPNFTCLFTSAVKPRKLKFERITLDEGQKKLKNSKSTNLKKYYPSESSTIYISLFLLEFI
jgi:hypothetical protein